MPETGVSFARLARRPRSPGRLWGAAAGRPGRHVVYVANPTGEAIDAVVDPGIPLGTVREIWGDRPVQVDDGRIRERLEAYTINVYESVR